MTRNDRFLRRLYVEPLERRELLCSAAVGTSILQSAQNTLLARSHISSNVAASISHNNAGGDQSSETFLVTTLTNSSGVIEGTASLETDAAGNQKLVISVVGAAAGATYSVSINGTNGTTDLGTLTTDANGNGRLVLTSTATTTTSASLGAKCGGDSGSTTTGTLPDGFTLAAGATIALAPTDPSLDTLNGTFATATGDIGVGLGGNGFGGCHGDNGATLSRLLAMLSDGASASGKAVYTTITHADGTTDEILRVRVTGADANTTLDVSVTTTASDGSLTTTPLGSITTDASGNGYLVLSTNPKTTNVGQLPAGLAISSTSTITVGTTITGTFAQPTSGGGCSTSSSLQLASRIPARRR